MSTISGGTAGQAKGDYQDLVYARKKEELWGYFYGLPTGKRFRILFWETRLFLIFWVGYAACVFFWKHVALGIPTSRYVPFLAHLIDMRAFAQAPVTAPDMLMGLTPAQWRLSIWLSFHFVLIVVLGACVFHMLYKKRPNAWVAKTATFLLGFLVKAVSGLVP
jgi:hypothetical protein